MSDLTEFLLARIVEDEDRARRAAFGYGAEWRTEIDSAEDWPVVHADGKRDMVGCEDGDVTQHIARHDPARVLAECEAKRRIVEKALNYSDAQYPNYEGGYASASEDAVALLAAVYADHPDYQESWRP